MAFAGNSLTSAPDLRAAGNLIQDLDLLIGSTAMCYELTLLTNNRRHFQRMEGLEIISV